MTLEERINMLEITVASQQAEIAELRNPAAMKAAIQSALRPGGAIHSTITGNGWSLRVKEGKASLGDEGVFGGVVTAAQNQTAELEATPSQNYDKERDLLLDNATALTRDSLRLSHL